MYHPIRRKGGAVRQDVGAFVPMSVIADGASEAVYLGAAMATTALGKQSVTSKLEAVGFGFLVPVFLIDTCLDFDLDALTSHASTLALLPRWSAPECSPCCCFR